jgi:hypothetical protein
MYDGRQVNRFPQVEGAVTRKIRAGTVRVVDWVATREKCGVGVVSGRATAISGAFVVMMISEVGSEVLLSAARLAVVGALAIVE